ncbi:hypothetical protein IV203_026853 [Nitzschia inconspicua]|uniref:Uncharacterized protein n=1 Tax=Nitzschia inconspicua TaxID=303405 RepID=A0A9K3P7I1_9STRA|nr:hypothetical protein IV203_006796 [Nitzschia inconspicua]KAG7363492.1 hypothetical protein IV203_026853 [Nitzschia inconspicua]
MKFSFKALLMMSLLAVGSLAEEEDVCETQTTTLDEDEALQEALTNMKNATAGLIIPPEDSPTIVVEGSVENDGIEEYCVVTGTTLDCRFNYSDFTSPVESACVNGGGQYYAGDARITCQGYPQRTEFNYISAPLCVGADCEGVDDLFETAWEDLAKSLTIPGVVTCAAYFDDVDAPLPAAGATWMTSLSLVLSVGVVAIF